MAFLFDTDIIIDYLRNDEDAVAFIEANSEDAYLSAITVAELYQGVREGKERAKLAQTFLAFTILPVTSDIAECGGIFSRDYRRSHGCGLADCIIAATVDLHGLTLQTLNKNYYPMVKAISVPYKKAK